MLEASQLVTKLLKLAEEKRNEEIPSNYSGILPILLIRRKCIAKGIEIAAEVVAKEFGIRISEDFLRVVHSKEVRRA